MYSQTAQVGVPFELSLQLHFITENPYKDLAPRLSVRSPDGYFLEVPMFWQGERRFAARFCPMMAGTYDYQLMTSQGFDVAPSVASGTFKAIPYRGENPLFLHGAPRRDASGRYLCYADGTPFFWLADTWWYGATARCRWPEDFNRLVQDRVMKGFSVVQIVVGIPPEVDAGHPDVANEGGDPFLRRWDLVNPAYFDYADKRIDALVKAGIVPCILGGWGYQIDWMGVASMTRYWRYLVARYAAYPAVWCLAGESDMLDLPVHAHTPARQAIVNRLYREAVHLPTPARNLLRRARQMMRDPLGGHSERRMARRRQWQTVGAAVAATDPWQRPITTHPSADATAHESLNEPSWLSLTGIQSGHAEASRATMFSTIMEIRQRHPHLPVINLEPWYEGILGRFWAADQRYAFWASMLGGAAGHSYGAHGLWQMACHDGFLGHWGDANWEEAYQLPGGQHLGVGQRLLAQVPWWRLEPAPQQVRSGTPAKPSAQPLVGSIDGEHYLIYLPIEAQSENWVFWTGSQGTITLQAAWWNPRTGQTHTIHQPGLISVFDQSLQLPPKPTAEDWILAISFGRKATSLPVPGN